MSLCTNALGDYVNPDCEEIYGGGIRSIIIFQGVLPEDPSNAQDIQDLLDSGDAKLLTGLKVGINEASPVTNPSVRSCSPEVVTTYEREATIMDGNAIAGNVEFYNTLNASTGFEAAGVLLWHCDVDRVQFIDKPTNFTGSFIVPNDNNAEPQHFSFIAKWKSKGDALLYDSPAGIFTD